MFTTTAAKNKVGLPVDESETTLNRHYASPTCVLKVEYF